MLQTDPLFLADKAFSAVSASTLRSLRLQIFIAEIAEGFAEFAKALFPAFGRRKPPPGETSGSESVTQESGLSASQKDLVSSKYNGQES